MPLFSEEMDKETQTSAELDVNPDDQTSPGYFLVGSVSYLCWDENNCLRSVVGMERSRGVT